SLDYQLWNIITNGSKIPTKIVDGQRVLKINSEFNDNDYKLLQLNAKVKHVFCALSASEFNRVSTLNSTKEMWDRHLIIYEGTNQVKDTKINRLVHEYELFTMIENENISSMYTRFNDIINALKVTAIGEAKNLSTLPLEDLLGSLMTHELQMNDQDKNDHKKRTIVSKASKDQSKEEGDQDDEMALLTKR
ncbi:LOW QUALITY PROTEIN: UBN2 domain-containing protein, partial [Cephalotus follicularis]